MKFKLLTMLSLSFISLLITPVASGLQDNQDISEITLEMMPGSSHSGREFKINFRQDGTALYDGTANVKLKGKYEGKISKEEFNQLVELIKSKDFYALKSTFPSSRSTAIASQSNMPTIVSPTVITSIVSDGKRKKIERAVNTKINYPNAPAKELLEIENAITTLATKVKWEKR